MMMMMIAVGAIEILTKGKLVFPRQGKGFFSQWVSSKIMAR
jgi:hypothetical protein